MEEKFVDAVSNILNQQEPSANETCLALKKLGLDSFKQFKQMEFAKKLNPTLLIECIKNNRVLNVFVPLNPLVSDLPEDTKAINVVKLFVPDMLELLKLEVSELQDENERLKQELQEIRRREYEKSLIIKEKNEAEPNQLKNWEDELGVPLEIFLSALKNKILIAEIERNQKLSDWKKGRYSVQPVYNSKPTDYDANGELVHLPPRWEFYYNFHAIQSEEDYRMGYEPYIFSDYVVVSEFGKTWGLEKEDFERGGE